MVPFRTPDLVFQKPQDNGEKMISLLRAIGAYAEGFSAYPIIRRENTLLKEHKAKEGFSILQVVVSHSQDVRPMTNVQTRAKGLHLHGGGGGMGSTYLGTLRPGTPGPEGGSHPLQCSTISPRTPGLFADKGGYAFGGSLSDAVFDDGGADDLWEEWMGWKGAKFYPTSDRLIFKS